MIPWNVYEIPWFMRNHFMKFQNWIGHWTNLWWFMYYSLGDG
jgi:hypothetical protein